MVGSRIQFRINRKDGRKERRAGEEEAKERRAGSQMNGRQGMAPTSCWKQCDCMRNIENFMEVELKEFIL